ncbi:MAG TPA: NADH pyrophosphatase zinc ribbon domain-containing protein [Anaerolineae bacterium]|mgnify:CR=1 FL=1|nr:NADH pyrophosphatase zinc ribbon domain-containing protein [Anaerolineae bacterium]HQK14253.1 NADH pyrophosphatase zinc ribbon domain-containing protein [Anaerolineae bacterium]
MLADIHSLLVHGIAAAKAGEKSSARRYLERVLLDSDATRDEKVQAHLWLSRISDTPTEQHEHLEQALALDPLNTLARRELAILNGQLKEEDIIDPDRPPAQAPDAAPETIKAKRFTCPQCGGAMQFEPDGTMLYCAYCNHRQTVFSALTEGLAIEEHDFILAMATAKGHAVPAGVHTLRCQGCQAQLITSGKISAKCPYCGSPHVVEVETLALVQPEGIIPFAVTAEKAQKTFRLWLNKHIHSDQIRTTRVRGLYLPAWTFDISREIRWRGIEPEGSPIPGVGRGMGISTVSGTSRLRVHEGNYYAYEDDVLVMATHTLPSDLLSVSQKFLLEEAVPYDSAYLADWPAEIYSISAADASLVARRIALEKGKKAARLQALTNVPDIENLQVSSPNIAVLAYKLLLLPFWIANYRYEGDIYTVAINGQTNHICGQKPPGLLKKFFGNLFG